MTISAYYFHSFRQLLDMMGMCIAGFHPRPPRPSNPQDDRQEQMHEEDQWQWELWNSKANELLERKVVHGTLHVRSSVGIISDEDREP